MKKATMSTTETRPSTAKPSGHPTTGRPTGRNGPRLLALVLVLAALVTAGLLVWRSLGGPPGQPAPTSTQTDGTVNSSGYDRQDADLDGTVNSSGFDRSTSDLDWSIGYGPGSTMYREQVPSHVDLRAGYGPGSSLHRAQIPSGR